MQVDLYGSLSSDIEEVKDLIEELSRCDLEPHESAYAVDDYYKSARGGQCRITVKKNIDAFDGEPLESEFPEYPILVYVECDDADAALMQENLQKEGDRLSLLSRQS